MELLSNLIIGFQTASDPTVLMYCFIGVFLGTLVGVLPGIGSLAAISLLLPLTYHIDATLAIVMLAGIYYGAEYGGSTSSILLNLPGTASSVITCLDGYPMTQQGRAGVALFMATIASLVGGVIGTVALIFLSNYVVTAGLNFGPAEYFSLTLLGLIASSTLMEQSKIRGLAMVTVGLLLGTVGTDVDTGITRFDFGITGLMDGIGLVVLVTGLFGITEIIANAGNRNCTIVQKITLKTMLPTSIELRDSLWPMLRASSIGCFFGALPGIGSAVAAFSAYATEKRISKHPEKFGQGAIEGIVAPEAANNSAAQASFIPTLTLGIPGSATAAIILGSLMLHGIQPGPLLISEQPTLFWGLVFSFLIGNLLLVILNVPLISIWVSILRIPYSLLYPIIVIFMILGVYSIGNSTTDVIMMACVGAIGYLMVLLKFSATPLLLGFILGPLMEENFRRAVSISQGNINIFIDRPISAVLLIGSIMFLAVPLVLQGQSKLCKKSDLGNC